MWIILFVVIFISIFSHSTFKIFRNIDVLLITSSILMFSGMIWTCLIFTFIYSLILDSIFMNFLGINVMCYLLVLLVLFYLCKNMNTDNLLTEIFILFVACLFKNLIYTLLVFFFYWDGRFYFLPTGIFLQIVFTICTGAAVFWIIDLLRSGIVRWQNTK